MKIVLLDGYAQGQVFTWREAPPIWKLLKPLGTSPSFECDDEDCEFIPEQPEQIEYKRTFISEDKKWALYSISGDGETIVNSRDWVRPKDRIAKAMPIYLMDLSLASQIVPFKT